MAAPAQTYDTLTEDVRKYLERGQPADTTVYEQIPRLIMMGQLRLTKESKTLVTTTALTNTMMTGQPIISKPTNWRNLESFMLRDAEGNAFPIYPRHFSFGEFYWPNPTETGKPNYYSDVDYQHWKIYPTPDYNYDFLIMCQEPTPISDLVQTNFFTQYAYDVLLHACLLEAWTFVKDAQKAQMEQSIYDRLLQGLSFEDDERKTDKSISGPGADK